MGWLGCSCLTTLVFLHGILLSASVAAADGLPLDWPTRARDHLALDSHAAGESRCMFCTLRRLAENMPAWHPLVMPSGTALEPAEGMGQRVSKGC